MYDADHRERHNVTPALDHPVSGDRVVCDAANVVSDANDVVSSMGVVFNKFSDIAPIGQFQPAVSGVRAVMPDLRVGDGNEIDPIPGFQGIRRVEPRNTPTMQAAAFNFDNFWDGRARHDFNGGSVFGAADPQRHVWVTGPGLGTLTPTRQLIKFSSVASLATGPALSEFEMSFLGRNWPKLGKKLCSRASRRSRTSSSIRTTVCWARSQPTRQSQPELLVRRRAPDASDGQTWPVRVVSDADPDCVSTPPSGTTSARDISTAATPTAIACCIRTNAPAPPQSRF